MPLTTMAHEDGAGTDFAALRAERRARVAAEMLRRDVDVLLLSHPANAKYVAGHRGLWRAVLGAFGPTCVFVRSTGQVHLFGATWDDGVPAEIPHANLTGLTWNPRVSAEALGAVPGLREARTIAADGMSPAFAGPLARIAPRAVLADGDDLMRRVRRVKSPAEIGCITTALAIAEGAMSRTLADLRPGVTGNELRGGFARHAASYGTTIPAHEATFTASPREEPDGSAPVPRLRCDDRPLLAGDLVIAAGGVMYAGYEGSVALTRLCAGPSARPGTRSAALGERCHDVLDRLVEACRPGAAAGDLRAVLRRAGEPPPPLPFPLLHGTGMGVEPPLLAGTPADTPPGEEDDVLEAGMVVTVQACVRRPGVGAHLAKAVVEITGDGPRRLTRLT
jgi:Xaa-Pro aminopeptidase